MDIFEAIRINFFGKIEDLLRNDLFILDSNDKDLHTPLHIAVKLGNKRIVKFLLDNGANVTARNNIGDTALHLAVRYNNVELITLLLENNIDINCTNDDGDTALLLAVTFNRIRTVELLLEKKADINIKNKRGFSAIKPLIIINKYEHESKGLVKFYHFLKVNEKRNSPFEKIYKQILHDGGVKNIIFTTLEKLIAHEDNRNCFSELTSSLFKNKIDKILYNANVKAYLQLTIREKKQFFCKTMIYIALSKLFGDVTKDIMNYVKIDENVINKVIECNIIKDFRTVRFIQNLENCLKLFSIEPVNQATGKNLYLLLKKDLSSVKKEYREHPLVQRPVSKACEKLKKYCENDTSINKKLMLRFIIEIENRYCMGNRDHARS